MNLAVRITLIAVLSFVAQTYFPWWTAVLVAFLVELILGNASKTAFFSGFYGIAIPWMALSTYIDVNSESVLSVRILELFKLPQYSILLIVVTGLLGGLVGGLATTSAGWIKMAISGKDGE